MYRRQKGMGYLAEASCSEAGVEDNIMSVMGVSAHKK